MHVQLWSPDTCTCVIYQRVDDDGVITNITDDEATRLSGQPQSRGFICLIHRPYGDVFAVVLRENQGKNQALDEIQQLRPDITGANYRWSFDEDRVLQVSLVDVTLTPAERRKLQAALDHRLGQGKARVG